MNRAKSTSRRHDPKAFQEFDIELSEPTELPIELPAGDDLRVRYTNIYGHVSHFEGPRHRVISRLRAHGYAVWDKLTMTKERQR